MVFKNKTQATEDRKRNIKDMNFNTKDLENRLPNNKHHYYKHLQSFRAKDRHRSRISILHTQSLPVKCLELGALGFIVNHFFAFCAGDFTPG